MTESLTINLLIAALIVIPAFSIVAAVILVRVSTLRPFTSTGLSERAISAVLKAVASTLIAFVILNGIFHWLTLARPLGIGLIAVALLLLEIPSVIWLALYWGNRFRGDE